jgi:protein TonB
MMPATRTQSPGRRLAHRALVLLGSTAMTTGVFLVLPLIQAISDRNADDSLVRSVDTVQMPPPPAPPEPEPEPETKPDDKPPELQPNLPQLDLSQLEIALNPAMTGGWMSGNFGIDTASLNAGKGASAALFSSMDLDQKPRATYQPSPVLTGNLRRLTPGRVVVLFVVDESGRVKSAKVDDASNPAFAEPALEAVKKWRFEPGKRNGKPVGFRLKQTITFPKGS